MRSKSSIILVLFLLVLAQGAAARPQAQRKEAPRGDHRIGNRLLKEGARLHNGARYEEAIAKFKEAYEKDPALTRVLLLIGASSLNLGRVEEALDYYERYEQSDKAARPEDRARLRAYFEEAAAHIEELLRAAPGRGELYLSAGRARLALSQLGPALDHFERYGREHRPKGRDAERLRGHYAALRERLLVLSQKEPPQKDVLLLLSRVCSDLGLKEESLRYYQRYQALLPKAPAPLAAPPRRLVRGPRPRFRLALGTVALAGGVTILGFGISALAQNGGCAERFTPPLYGCSMDYNTLPVGAGLLVGGLLVAAAGAVLIALPGERRSVAIAPSLPGGAAGMALAYEF